MVFNLKKINYKEATEFFKDKNVVFTGKGFLVRGELWQIIRQCKGNVGNTVTNKTDILIVGTKPGSKLRKAERMGIDIITIEEFKEILLGVQIGGIKEVKIKKDWFIIE